MRFTGHIIKGHYDQLIFETHNAYNQTFTMSDNFSITALLYNIILGRVPFITDRNGTRR